MSAALSVARSKLEKLASLRKPPEDSDSDDDDNSGSRRPMPKKYDSSSDEEPSVATKKPAAAPRPRPQPQATCSEPAPVDARAAASSSPGVTTRSRAKRQGASSPGGLDGAGASRPRQPPKEPTPATDACIVLDGDDARDSDNERDVPRVTIKVKDSSGEMPFKVKTTDRLLEKLRAAYARKRGVSPSSVKLTFDGLALEEGQTASSLGMEDGDCVDAYAASSST
eukprot:tig00020800_g13736.t1